jgi:hypothetical protein
MTNVFKNALMLPPGIVAPTGNANAYVDAVDIAVQGLGTVSGGNVATHVLGYLRARMFAATAPLSAGIVDRLANPITLGTYAGDATKNAADANFNGQASIDLSPLNGVGSGNNCPLQLGPGFRLNAALTTMPGSWTVVSACRLVSSPAATSNFFGSSDGIWGYFNNTGTLEWRVDGSHGYSVSGALTPGTAAVIWYSWDNSALTFRFGVNSGATVSQQTIAYSYSPVANDKVFPFGFTSLNGGNAFDGQFEGWLLLDKAYMNGSVPADDAAFGNMIAAYAALAT